MPEDKDTNIEELKALLKVPGALRFVTARHLCDPKYLEGPYCEPKTAEELEICAAFEFPLTDPRHFVIHEVVSLEARPDGTMAAVTAEGDWCVGSPAGLMRALRKAREV